MCVCVCGPTVNSPMSIVLLCEGAASSTTSTTPAGGGDLFYPLFQFSLEEVLHHLLFCLAHFKGGSTPLFLLDSFAVLRRPDGLLWHLGRGPRHLSGASYLSNLVNASSRVLWEAVPAWMVLTRRKFLWTSSRHQLPLQMKAYIKTFVQCFHSHSFIYFSVFCHCVRARPWWRGKTSRAAGDCYRS